MCKKDETGRISAIRSQAVTLIMDEHGVNENILCLGRATDI
ncbi:hypothetical protein [Geomonas oryzisoli]|nr:hypothetical protein [Geomonas oryzisoli]